MTDHLLMLMAPTNIHNCPPLSLKIEGWVLMRPKSHVARLRDVQNNI